MKPAAQREAVRYAQRQHGYSQRRACQLVGCNRKTARHVSRRLDDSALRQRMVELAQDKRRFGYRRLCVLLRREGFRLNPKRIYRIYTEEKLALRPKHRKRLKSEKRGRPQMAQAANEVWTMDFMSDRLSDGRTFRTLNVLDVFTRRCLGIEVDTSLSGERVVRVLDKLIAEHGKPALLQIDNGPEFRCKAVDVWAQKNGILLHFIDPGKPSQNGHIESFNGRFRDECLDQEWFLHLKEARHKIELWRREYNEERPHSSLGYLTPLEWTAKHQIPSGLEHPGNLILGVTHPTSRGTADTEPCSASFGPIH